MVTIAWNEEENAPILDENGDTREPLVGEWSATIKVDWNDYEEGDWMTKKEHHPQLVITPDPIMPITNIVFSGAGYDETQPDGRIDLLTGISVSISFDVALPNGAKFTIPLRNSDTNELKTIRANVSNGNVIKTFKMNRSGFWVINSKEVNDVGQEGVNFTMDEITILAQDD